MMLERIHNVAYRCNDAKETVEWYVKYLNMNFVLAIAEDLVPSTKAPDPYMHLFLDAGQGNVLAFFELPNSPAMGRDTNTPDWVQHIAFKIDSVKTLEETKKRLEEAGINVVGVTDHTMIATWHAVAGYRNFKYMETFPDLFSHGEEFVQNLVPPTKGLLQISDGTGLGLVVDEKKIDTFRIPQVELSIG